MSTPGNDPDRPSPADVLPFENELLDRCTRCLRLRGSCRPVASTCDERIIAATLTPTAEDGERRTAA